MGIISIFSHLYPLLYATIGYRTCFFVFIPNLFSFRRVFSPNILPNTRIRLVLVGIVRLFSIPYPYLACLVGIVRSFSIPHPYLACLVGIVRLFSIPYPHLACLVGIVRSFSIPYPHLTRRLVYHTYSSTAIPRNQASSSNNSHIQTQI